MALTSKQVDAEFLDVLLRENDVWTKRGNLHARQLDVDEEIMLNDGQTQTKQTCKADEWVVVSQAGEQYVMRDEVFRDRYDFDRAQRAQGSLGAQGFALYAAKGKVYAHVLTEADVAKFPGGCFVPPWSTSELVHVAVGGVLVLPKKEDDKKGVAAGAPQQGEGENQAAGGEDEAAGSSQQVEGKGKGKDKAEAAGIYFISEEEFFGAYGKGDAAAPPRPTMERRHRKEGAAGRRSPEHVDGFDTHMKFLLPGSDNVSEACVRPAIGGDPAYLVVTTRPGLHLLVFNLNSFNLELCLSLEKLGAPNFTPFCSFHRGDYSWLHVSYHVFQWTDLVQRFGGKDVAGLTSIDTTMSRFAAFTPKGRVVWTEKPLVKHKSAREQEPHSLVLQADSRMVASTSEEKVFVVVTTNEKKLHALALHDSDEPKLSKEAPCVGKGRLVPFAIHPKLLFVLDDDSLTVYRQEDLGKHAVFQHFKLERLPDVGVLLSPHPSLDCMVAGRKNVFQIVQNGNDHEAVCLATLPAGLKIVAVHERGVAVGDGQGHLLVLLKSSHPVLQFEPEAEADVHAPVAQKKSHVQPSQQPLLQQQQQQQEQQQQQQQQPPHPSGKVLVCTDPRNDTLVIAHNGALIVHRHCRLDNHGGERTEFPTGLDEPLDALCVDWGQRKGKQPLAFVAHKGGVEVFDITSKQRTMSIPIRHATMLCAVRGDRDGNLWDAREASAGKLWIAREGSSVAQWEACGGSSGSLFVGCADKRGTISQFSLDHLEQSPNQLHVKAGVGGQVQKLLSLGDCAVAICQPANVPINNDNDSDNDNDNDSDDKKVTIQRLFVKPRDPPEVNTRTMEWESLGSSHRRLVGTSGSAIEIYNRQGISVHSRRTTGEVVHVAAEQINNCVVFVTKSKDPIEYPWIVCLLKIAADDDNSGNGAKGEGSRKKEEGPEDETRARPVGTQWQLASFRDEVKACHVMKRSIAVHCSTSVRVIRMRPCEYFPRVFDLLVRPLPEGARDDEDAMRGVASGKEVLWSRLLRRPDALHSALTQTRLRLLPLVSIPSLLSLALATCSGPQQEGLVGVVLTAYTTLLERHNERLQGREDPTEGWEVDFHAIDARFLKVLLVIVEKFPTVAAKFLCSVPLVRLRKRDEDRVFERGVPQGVEAKADTKIVVGSSEELDGMDWQGKEGEWPRTVGDYVVPFPTHAQGSSSSNDDDDDLLVTILHVDSEAFVDGIALKTVITHRWHTYARGMHAIRLFLFFISLALTTTISFLSPSSTPRGTAVGVFTVLGLFLVFSVERGAKEYFYSKQSPWEYLRLPFRALEVLRLCLTVACTVAFAVTAEWGGDKGEGCEKWFRGLASALVFVHWIGLLRLLQPYRAFGPPIRTIAQIAWDVRYFLLVMTIAVLAICNAVFTALMPSERKENYKHVPIALYTSFKSTVLGDVDLIDTLEVDHSARRWLFRTLALMASLLVTVVLLNLLIAIMGDSHSHIQERAEIEFQLLRARMIVVQQSHYGSLKALMDFGLGGGGVERGPEEGKKGAPRFRSASSYSQLQCEDEPEANAGRFPVSARWPKPVVGFARWVVWLVFAYPMDRVLSLAGAKRDAMYHPWLHVLVAHHLSMDDVSNSGRWQGALHVLKAQITDQVAKQAEVDQKQDKRLLDIETNLKSVLGHLSNKPDSK